MQLDWVWNGHEPEGQQVGRPGHCFQARAVRFAVNYAFGIAVATSQTLPSVVHRPNGDGPLPLHRSFAGSGSWWTMMRSSLEPHPS